MNRKVNVGVIGCGGAAWTGHLPWIWDHPDAELAAVCDPMTNRAAEAQRRYQVPVSTADYRELLARPDIDGVSICTPPDSHLEIVLAAAAHGKHMLLEKPMARSVAECEEMEAAVMAS